MVNGERGLDRVFDPFTGFTAQPAGEELILQFVVKFMNRQVEKPRLLHVALTGLAGSKMHLHYPSLPHREFAVERCGNDLYYLLARRQNEHEQEGFRMFQLKDDALVRHSLSRSDKPVDLDTSPEGHSRSMHDHPKIARRQLQDLADLLSSEPVHFAKTENAGDAVWQL